MTKYLVAALAASLALSGLWIWFQAGRIGRLQSQVSGLEASLKRAVDAAEECDRGVQALLDAARDARLEAARMTEAARRAGDVAARAAARRMTAPPAVPGDVCASADVESRAWLGGRR